MTGSIQTDYEFETAIFSISMPDFVTRDMLITLQEELLARLPNLASAGQVKLLLDTNKHEFESIGCLQLLREILADKRVNNYISKGAFIMPPAHGKPGLISSSLGRFNSREQAYAWLVGTGTGGKSQT